MVMAMVMEMVLTALAAVLLSFLVAKLVSAVVGGGEVRDREAEMAVAEEGDGGGIVGEKVESVAVVNGFEVVEERSGSEMFTAVAVVCGFGGDMERNVGGDEEVELAVVEEDEEVESHPFVEVLGSGFLEVDEICGGVDEKEGGTGVEFEHDNVGRSSLDELVSGPEGEPLEEKDKEGGEAKAMDVEDANSGREEILIELKGEVSGPIKECTRNIVDEGCDNEYEETTEAKDVVDFVGLVIEEDNSVTEGGANRFEEMAEPVDVAKRIGGVIGEERIVNEGYKSQDEEQEGHKDINLEVKEEVTEERSGSSEEDDGWEGIEMSKLYNEYKLAAAFVRKEEKDGKFSNTSSDLKRELYGLQKIVMEGPCREAQPMAIKMSARAKWNAWQRLGNMNPEDAMQQYIELVSGLKPQSSGVDDQSHNIESTKLSVSDPDPSKPQNESQKKKQLTCDGQVIDIGSSCL